MKNIPDYFNIQPFTYISFPYQILHTSIGSHIPLHRHNFIEMEFVLSGCGKEIINGMEHELRSGSFSIILPWHMHEIIADESNPLKIIKCSFGFETLMDSSPYLELDDLIFNKSGTKPFVYFEGTDFQYIKDILNYLLLEYEDNKQWKKTMFKVKIAEIFILFDRKSEEISAVQTTIRKFQNDISIWEVIYYIHLKFNTEITLLTLAQKFHYSKPYLNTLLKRHTGLNFSDLLEETRIRHACAYMMVFGMQPSQVAHIVGFKEKRAFIRAFKKVKGFTPEDFRKIYFSNNEKVNSLTVSSNIYSQVIYYLHLHYKDELALGDIARILHYSENYLCSLLKAQTGQSFIDLLHEVRIFHASALLKVTDKPIYEIAFAVGFNSLETFFRVFRNLKGISPGKYRGLPLKSE